MPARPHILLSGCGKMGGAMLARWRELGLYQSIQVVEPHGVKGHDAPCVPGVADLPADFAPDMIVFAVKPQTLPEMIADYRPLAEKGAAVLSIAAGKPLSFFETHLGADAKIIRAMPNTPAAIGKGMTVACANARAGAADRETAAALLSATGDLLWVEDESLLNPVTALSGSGPAYVFLLVEVLEKAGVHIGLAPDIARRLARQTVIGSAALAESLPGAPAAELRQNVTSPGGTTEAALSVLMSSAMQDIFNDALAAAAKRAGELAR